MNITTKSGLYEVAELYEIISTSSSNDTIQEWGFTVSFINLDTNQAENGGKTLEAEVILSRKTTDYHKVCEEGTLACDIAKLYNEEDPSANGLYYHTSSLANSAADNSYRYAGANPNNYVCFGSNETPCPSNNLYRIIGVFNDQVKLIKADYATSAELGTNGDYSSNTYSASSYDTYKGNLTTINTYYWNDVNYDLADEETGYANVWSYSELNKTNLNSNFLNGFDTAWQEMIATTKWKVGGMGADAYELSFKITHDYEINNPNSDVETTYNAKIGLMYVSDYLYAAQPEDWDTTMGNYLYVDNANSNNNWMYMGLVEWTISRISDYSHGAFTVYDDGTFYDDDVSVNHAIRPVFYLNSNVKYISGTGTQSDPFRIA